MPLLDHFRAPLMNRLPWTSLFHGWAVRVADSLCAQVPDQYLVGERLRSAGTPEFDITSYGRWVGADLTDDARANLMPDERSGWQPPQPDVVADADPPDQYEIHIRLTDDLRKPVAIVAFVCPSHNTDAGRTRPFADRVATQIRSGVCVVVMDIVSDPRGQQHAKILDRLGVASAVDLPASPGLYAVTYRPAVRHGRPVMDVWTQAFGIGDPLPTMPLRLTGDLFVPVDFEAAYMEACRKRKLLP